MLTRCKNWDACILMAFKIAKLQSIWDHGVNINFNSFIQCLETFLKLFNVIINVFNFNFDVFTAMLEITLSQRAAYHYQ